jgi:hypothetical protein
VYEGDAFGGEIRPPKAPGVRPSEREMVMASNHFWRYKTDPRRVENNGAALCNGGRATFSSLWRYEAGKNRVEAILRAWREAKRADDASPRAGRAPVDSRTAAQLLRVVSHGTTEHSVVFRPDEMDFDIAVARLDAPAWDAADARWHTISFEDLFRA